MVPTDNEEKATRRGPRHEPVNEPDPAADSTAETQPAEEQAPSRYRLVPADWTVHDVSFAHGPAGEFLTIGRTPEFIVDAADADGYMTAAAEAGFPLVKEAVEA